MRPHSLPSILLACVSIASACAPSAIGGFGPPVDAAAFDSPTSDTADSVSPTDGPANEMPPPVDGGDVPVSDAPVADAPVADTPVSDVPADVTPMECRSDRDCSAANLVCSRTTMRCVDCNTNADCLDERVCVASRCTAVTRCTTSRVCTNQVCSTTLGYCVDCVADADCAMGELCRTDTTCGPQACAPSSTRCIDATHMSVCDARGSGATTQACAAGQSCRGDRCMTNVCTPGESSCADISTRRVCNADGGGYTTSPCSMVTSCSAGACVARVCVPGAATCLDANTRSACNPDGLGTSTTSCSSAPHATGSCMGGACAFACSTGYSDCDRDPSNGCESLLASDAANCGACGRACPSGQSCSSGACVSCPPAATAPRVLFYGPLGSVERGAVPTGAVVTVASDSMWRAMSATDFAGYNVIILGDPDSHTTITASQYSAAIATASVWGSVVRGRAVISGLDAGFHITRTDGTPVSPGAGVFLRATLAWVAAGAGTGLYVSSSMAQGLGFLSGVGSFSSVSASGETVSIVASHPILVGSSAASLSNWSVSYHSTISAFPSDYTRLVQTTAGSTLVIARNSTICER